MGVLGLNPPMSKRQHRIEFPSEVEPARDFIAALVARHGKQIDDVKEQVKSLTKQVESLTKQVQILTPGVILNRDQAKMYLGGKRLQWCWAHLKRDTQKFIDSPDRRSCQSLLHSKYRRTEKPYTGPGTVTVLSLVCLH